MNGTSAASFFGSPGIICCLFWGALVGPLSAQSLAPPAQDDVLEFKGFGVAYTAQINLGPTFTMECWISLDAASPYQTIMGKVNNPRGADPYMNYAIGLDSTGLLPIFAQTTGQPGTYRQITASSNTSLHAWTHLAAVLDSGTMRLYVNGRQVASDLSPGPPTGAAVPFALGGGIPDGQSPCCSYYGAMREARVWSRALSASDLQTYAARKLTGNELGLVANWPLADGAGGVARDVGPRGISLTLQDSATWIRTSLYDGGPYWDFLTLLDSPGYGIGTSVDMGANGLTALFAFERDVTTPGPARAFRWVGNRIMDVTPSVLPIADINVNSPRDFAVADFNGDGRLDVFLATHGVDQPPFLGGQSHVFMQSAAGALVDETASRIPKINAFTHSVAAADIDGDGDIDLYLGNLCCGKNSDGSPLGPQLYVNDGTGHFNATTSGLPDIVSKLTQTFTSSRFIEVNNDGHPDLVLGSNQDSASNAVLLNDGRGNFATPEQNALPPKFGGTGWITIAIAPADYDGDGYTDLILSMTDNYQGDSALQLLLNNRNGTFRDATSQIPQDWPVVRASAGQLNGSWIQWVVPCDVNGDGWIDFVTSGDKIAPRLYINQGHGAFKDLTELMPTANPFSQVVAGDFDGDGKTDLLFSFGLGGYGIARNLKLNPARESLGVTVQSGGATAISSAGSRASTQVGYATTTVTSGTAPYGTAVFSFKQNGITVSEAAVPASPPTTSARLFIEFRTGVAAVAGRVESGMIDINTGIAIVNRSSAAANMMYTLRNLAGTTLATGHGSLDKGSHIAKFIDELKTIASDFDLTSNFPVTTQFASLEISSDQPISVTALRQTTNQRNEALFTTTPIADLTQPLMNTRVYFPQFVDGGGYTTVLFLLNTSNGVETGTFQIRDDKGAPLVVNQVGGTADSLFRYAIPSGGAFRFQTDGFPATAKVGSVQLTPDIGSSTPVGAGVFSYNPGGILVTESGIPAAASTTHARIYVDLSGGHNTGLAIANTATTNASVTIQAYQTDGINVVGTSQGPLQLAGTGHIAKFANELITGLPPGFTGVIDIISPTPFAALTLRSLNNERNEFLLTTFPIGDADRSAPAPIVFPQIADGGGYITQFVLLSAVDASSMTLNFYGDDGKPLSLAIGK